MTEAYSREGLNRQLASGEIDSEAYRAALAGAPGADRPVIPPKPSFEQVVEDLRNGKLCGANLSRINWRKADLSQALLAGADLSKAKLVKADLRNADLAGVNLTGADLTGADLSGADLTAADLTGVTLKDADLTGARLPKATARNLTAPAAKWRDSMAAGADLTFAELGKGEMQNVDLTDADLTDVNLADAKLAHCRFDRANLTRASLQNAVIEHCAFCAAKGQRLSLNLAALTDTDFFQADLSKADISNSFLERVNLSGADLRGTLLNVSEHREVNLTDAALTGASFKSMVGYSEEQLRALKERGARIDKFFLRRFGRLLWHSRLAQLLTAATFVALGGFLYWWVNEPAHWSYEKLHRTAMDLQQSADFAGSEQMLRLIFDKYEQDAAKVAQTKNELGALLVQTKQFGAAQEEFQFVIDNFTDQTGQVLTAEVGIANILVEKKDYAGAEARLLGIIKNYDHPQVNDARSRLAQLAKMQGDIEKAEAIWREVEGSATDENARIRAGFEMAQMYDEEQQYDKAIEKYREVVEQYGAGQAGAAALSAIIHLEAKRKSMARAAEVLEELKARYPDETEAILDGENFYANELLNDSRGEADGEAILKRIYTNHATSSRGFTAGNHLADYYLRTKRFDETDAILQNLLRDFPDNRQFQHQVIAKIAELELARNNPQAALAQLAAIDETAVDPGQAPQLFSAKARAQAALGNLEEARRIYRRMAEMYPEDPATQLEAKLGEADILRDARQFEEALKSYREALDLVNLPSVRLRVLQGVTAAYRAMGDLPAERRELEAMLAEVPPDRPERADIMRQIADNLLEQDQLEPALQLLREVANLDAPNQSVQALLRLQQIYVQRDQNELAAEIRAEIARRFPSDQRAQLAARTEAAGLLWRQGKTAAAIEEYQAISRAGDPVYRLSALQSLLQLYVDGDQAGPAAEAYETIVSEYAGQADDLANAAMVYAHLLRRTGRGAEAEAMYQQIIADNQGKVQALWALAQLAQFLLEQGRFDDAAQTCRTILADPIIADNPDEAARTRMKLGSIAEQSRDYATAKAEYEKALAATTNLNENLAAEQALIRVEAELGQIAEARKRLDGFRKKYPQQTAELEAAEMTVLQAMAREGKLEDAVRGYQDIVNTTRDKGNLAMAYHAIAQAQMTVGQFAEAEKTYGRMRQTFADDPQQLRAIDLGLGAALQQRRQYARALQLYERIITAYPDAGTRQQALASIAGIQATIGRLDQARQTYQTLVEENADAPMARAQGLLGLADLDARAGDLEQSIARLQKVLEMPVDDGMKVGVYHALAQLYMQQGRFTEARQVYERLGNQFPGNAEQLLAARFGEAETLRQNGRYDDALAIYREVAAQTGNGTEKARAQIAIGRTYLDKKDYEQAAQVLRGITDDKNIPPSLRTDAQVAMADLLRRRNDLDGARQLLETIQREAEDINLRQMAQSHIASIHMEQGNLAEAEKIYQEMRRTPDDETYRRVEAEMGLAEVARQRGQYEAARRLYQHARELSPEAQFQINALFAIAQSYIAESRLDQAAEIFRQILADHGQNRDAKINAELGLANILFERGKQDEALAAYHRIAEEYGNAQQVYWALSGIAQIHAQRGNVQEADKAYEEIKRRFPENTLGLADAKLNQANMLKNSGQREEAEKLYREIQQTYPGSRQAAASIEALGQIGLEFQDYSQAQQQFEKLLSDFKQDPDATYQGHIGLANLERQQGKPLEALAVVERALAAAKRRDQIIQTMVMKAQIQQEAGQMTQADQTYEKLLQDYSDHAWAKSEALTGRGNLRMAQGQFTEAAGLFEEVAEAFRGQPAADNALQALAGAYLALNQPERVIPLIERLAAEHRDDPNAVINVRMNLANKYATEGRYPQAAALLERTMTEYKGLPQTAWVKHALAQLAMAKRDWATAAAIYQAIREEFSGNRPAVIDAELGLADLARIQGEHDEALAAYEKVAEQYPSYSQSVRALQSMAEIYGEQNRPEDQERAYQRIIAEHAGDQSAMLSARIGLANALQARGDILTALEQFEFIFKNYPQSDQAPWAKAGAARIQFDIGNQKLALQMLEELIAAYPAEHEVVVGAKKFKEQILRRE